MTVITSSRLYGQTSRFTIWENCKIRESKQLLRRGRHEWQPVVCLQFALWNTSTWHNKFDSFCFNYYSMTLSSQTIKKEKRTTYGCYFWRTGRHLCCFLSSTRTSNFERFGKRVYHLYKSVRFMEKQLPAILKLVSMVASRNVDFFSQAVQTLAKNITRKVERQGLMTQGKKKRNREPNRYTEVPFVSKTFHWHHPFSVYFPTGYSTWKHLQMMKNYGREIRVLL